MNKKILSGLMALAMVTPAFADVTSAGGTGSVPVELNSEATSFSVTVPTGLPVNVAADGTVSVSQENYIVNNSFGPVAVKGAKIETVSGWKLKDFTSRFETLKVNAKEFGFQLNESNVNTDGSVAVTNFKPIDGGAKQKFSYDSKVAPQAEKVETQQIASVVFTLGWNDSKLDAIDKPHAKGTVVSKSKLEAQAKSKNGTLTFSREKYDSSKHGSGVDVSEAGDGSVMCVVKGQDVTVYGDGGVKAPTDCHYLFYGYQAKTMNMDGLDTSSVTSMSEMFDTCQATTINGLTSFDTSKVTTMYDMFCSSKTTSLDLSGFDTTNVTNMQYMFHVTNTATLDLSSFDMSKVSQTEYMFSGANATKVYCRTESEQQKMISSSSRTPAPSVFVVGTPQ